VDAIKPIDYSEIRANRPYCLLFWGLAMTEILKGNFKPARPVDVTPAQETLDDRFEREVKKRLDRLCRQEEGALGYQGVTPADPVVREGRGGSVLLQLLHDLPRMTRDRTQQLALDNARLNRPFFRRGHSLKDLRDASLGRGDSAVVVAAGPSAKRFDPSATLKRSGYRGTVIASESALYQCLRHGLVPHLIVSVDPHPMRIVRWFGDPNLGQATIDADDYFRRQDMDPSFSDELAHNRVVMELMARHGRALRIALASSASPDVVERVHRIGLQVYWWNPMLDDPDEPDSVTRALCRENGLPAMNAGGNVGTACWMMAHAVLGKTRVAVTGMDFGYYADTPYDKTQYYREALDLVGQDRLDEIFIKIFNPHTQTWFYTDPAYYWYRQAFLELAADADCVTYNCTGGGILFDEPVRVTPLDAFLAQTDSL
jgi:hypothetical protein